MTVSPRGEHVLSLDPADWRERSFQGRTLYSLSMSGGIPVIKASSNDSASILYRSVEINLDKTPCINWRWRIDNTLGDLDEKTKAGDDYPARVYVVIEPELFGTQPRSINYVWANALPVDTIWTNAYSKQVKMLAIRSGAAQTGRWLQEKRNVKADLERAFGETVTSVIGIAIMTDTDNSHTSATSYYSSLFFSRE